MAFFVQQAQVVAVDERNRLIDVQWIGMEGGKRGIIMINDPGSYALPAVGDQGLVIAQGVNYFYLGKIDYNYAAKVDGRVKNVLGKLIRSGVTALGNIRAGSWLSFPNTGDFSLLSQMADGIKYVTKTRKLTASSRTFEVLAHATKEVKVRIGAALRDIPATGESPVTGTSGSSALEVLFQIVYQTIQSARFHIGEVTDSLGIFELSSWGLPLRVVLETTAAPPTNTGVTGYKVDNAGNVEIKTTTGQVSIDGIAAAGILLGPAVPAPTHPVIYGDSLLLWLNTHTHSSPVGPTGVPITPAGSDLLSVKVFTS